MENRALGKGLSALIPENAEISQDAPVTEKVKYIEIIKIRENSLQPRVHYDEEKLTELKNSIKEKGVLQPILVRESGDGYEIVAGERRWRAAQALKMEKVPVLVKNVTNQEALVLALIENIQREDLNAIEEAHAYQRLIQDFSLSQESVAQSVGKDRSTVNNILRLLNLPAYIQDSVVSGDISMGHARALLGVERTDTQDKLFMDIKKKGLSVRETENLIRAAHSDSPKRRKSKERSHELVFLEEDIQRYLGTKVRILPQRKRGKIIIEYYSPDDLERVLGLIKE